MAYFKTGIVHPDRTWIGLTLALCGFLLPLLVSLPGLSDAGHIALSIFIAAVFLWVFEAVPIYATSLFIILMQVFLLSSDGPLLSQAPDIFEGYAPPPYASFLAVLSNPIIILFLAGFMLAEGAVKFNIDRSLTRSLLRPFGSKPSMILLGVMLVTGALSAFMSNTATTAMMMTVILPIIVKLDANDRFRVALALAIPVAANVGGIATPIGTPPNAVVMASLVSSGMPITFTTWVVMALPLVAIMLMVSWWILIRFYPVTTPEIIVSFGEKSEIDTRTLLMYGIFLVTILLWMTESWHGIPTGLVSMLPIALLTMTGILDKKDIRKLPWEVLWLVAGGLALGVSLGQTGLAEWMVGSVDWNTFSPFALLAVLAIVAIILANFLSHTVTATLLIPLAVSLTTGANQELGLLVAGLTIAISTSLSMILPISTPPNAIAISTGLVKTKDLALVGSMIAVIGLLFVLLFAVFYWKLFIP